MDTFKHHNHFMLHSSTFDEAERDIRLRFWVALALTLPLMLVSHGGFSFFPVPFISRQWLSGIISTPVVWWCGWPFIEGAYSALRSKTVTMFVLIAVAVLTSYGGSIVLALAGEHETFFEAAAMLVTFVLFGHWMEMKARRGTYHALKALFAVVPPHATVIREGKGVTIPTAELRLHDRVLVKPGDKIPQDGVIKKGSTTVDESLITGESIPRYRKEGDKVIGGSLSLTGAIEVLITHRGDDTVVAHISALIEQAQRSKSPGQRIADKAAVYLVLLAIGSGIVVFFYWYSKAHESIIRALTFALSAVVIACPDALGLATPTAVAVGTGIGARFNILFKSALTLELMATINVVMLDKTGTLTQGRPTVIALVPLEGIKEEELLYWAASTQKLARHPIGEALLEEARKRSLSLSQAISDFQVVEGQGVKARVDGAEMLSGTIGFLVHNHLIVTPIEEKAERFMKEGAMVTMVARNGKLIGFIAFADTVRPTAQKAVKELNQRGIETIMVTGDHALIAERVAQELGITRVIAEVTPAQKLEALKKLQKEGRRVAMVGDGINDAPALAQADVGIAIGTGTDVAFEAADIILMRSDPVDIVRSFELSKATTRKMKENLWWAALYNSSAIPIAGGALYHSYNIVISPQVAALFMSASSLFVALNALLLKKIEKTLRAL